MASWDSKDDGIASFFENHKCGDLCRVLDIDCEWYDPRKERKSVPRGMTDLLHAVDQSPKRNKT